VTPPTAKWVIGRGLLGTAVAAESGASFVASIDWSDPAVALADLERSLLQFFSGVDETWEIYWCAGRGVTSTPAAAMHVEGDVFEGFLRRLETGFASRLAGGSVFLASSVGGAYAGSVATPFTESTPPHPLSAYGDVKLRMERCLADLVDRTDLRGLVGRITNLYGPGQDLGKGQGLISVIVESYVTGRPVSIYVPLDTLRDYIYVDDCARVIHAAMTRLTAEQPGTLVVKIVGAMNALSIGAIIGELSRLRRRPVPVVVGQGVATGQAADLRVKSTVWPDLDGLVSTTLPEGLGAVFRAHLAAHMLPR
jgi:UDP-glucose 4-epimerase